MKEIEQKTTETRTNTKKNKNMKNITISGKRELI
jgi:hypothetical protein